MDINSYLIKLSSQLIVSPDETKRIDVSTSFLIGKIWENFQGTLADVKVFGSYDRGTFLPLSVNENSDIDILVIFKANVHNPDTYLRHLKEFAEKKYPRSGVYTAHPTITVELEHIRFELVPAFYNTWDILKIPASRSTELKWISSDPLFKEKLRQENKNENGLLIPMLKLFKYWNYKEGNPFSTYDVEKYAVSKYYTSCTTLKDYFYELITDLRSYEKSEKEKLAYIKLDDKRKRLIALEKNGLSEYFVMELQSFLPMPL